MVIVHCLAIYPLYQINKVRWLRNVVALIQRLPYSLNTGSYMAFRFITKASTKRKVKGL